MDGLRWACQRCCTAATAAGSSSPPPRTLRHGARRQPALLESSNRFLAARRCLCRYMECMQADGCRRLIGWLAVMQGVRVRRRKPHGSLRFWHQSCSPQACSPPATEDGETETLTAGRDRRRTAPRTEVVAAAAGDRGPRPQHHGDFRHDVTGAVEVPDDVDSRDTLDSALPHHTTTTHDNPTETLGGPSVPPATVADFFSFSSLLNFPWRLLVRR